MFSVIYIYLPCLPHSPIPISPCMRMSCNGCRALRKGCSSHCILRPCLRWINSPESQANATLFLARFYGRAGLFNLINSADHHLRPEIFQSLLYDACGRIVNPVYGSVGLLSSGDWKRCRAAVDAVLHGAAIIEMPGSRAAAIRFNGDIRHFSKDSAGGSFRRRAKRSGSRRRRLESVSAEPALTEPVGFTITGWNCGGDFILKRAPSHDDSSSVATVEQALFNRVQDPVPGEPEIGLDLNLSLSPARSAYGFTVIEVSDGEI